MAGDDKLRLSILLSEEEMEDQALRAQERINRRLRQTGGGVGGGGNGGGVPGTPRNHPAGEKGTKDQSQQDARTFGDMVGKLIADRLGIPELRQFLAKLFSPGQTTAQPGGQPVPQPSTPTPTPSPTTSSDPVAPPGPTPHPPPSAQPTSAKPPVIPPPQAAPSPAGGSAAGTGAAAGVAGGLVGGIVGAVAMKALDKIEDTMNKIQQHIQAKLLKLGEAFTSTADGVLDADPSKALKGLGNAAEGATILLPDFGIVSGKIAGMFNKFVDLMDGMTGKFAQFNPRLAAELRVFQMTQRGYNIMFASRLRPLLSEWLKLKMQILKIMSDNASAFTPLINLARLLVNRLSDFFEGIGLALKGVRFFHFVALKVAEGLFRLLATLPKWAGGGEWAKNAADNVAKNAEDVNPLNDKKKKDPMKVAQEQNQAFIRSIKGRDGPPAPQNANDRGGVGGGGGGGGNIARGQAPAAVNVPQPALPEFANNVTLNAQLSIQHDQAVQAAVLQLKDQIFAALGMARNESRLAVAMLDLQGRGAAL